MTDQLREQAEREIAEAARKLLQIAELINSLEGLPVDYSLARRLAEVAYQIEGSVDAPPVALEGKVDV